jgi:hypothetical protein
MADPRVGARPARVVGLTVQAVVIGVGLVLSALFCLAAVRTLGLAWPVTHPEGALVATVLRVRDGQPLYQEFRQYPYLIAPYPPLQPVVAGLASRALGLSNLGTVALARGLTFAASLATALLIWEIARVQGAGRWAALAGAGLFLALPFLDEWGFAVRPDTPGVALSLLALLALTRRPDRPWIAAVIAVLAFFTKQTALALPAAAMLWLLLGGRWRGAAAFAGTWALLAGIGVALLEVGTGGHYLLNTVLAHLYTPKNGLDFAARDIQPLFTDGWLPVGLAMLALVVIAARRDRASPQVLSALYFVTATVAALVTLRNTGSDVNYLIEPAAAACVLAALAIGFLWSGLGADRAAPSPLLRGRGGAAVWAPHVGLAGSIVLAVAAVVWGYDHWGYWQGAGGVQPVGRLPLQEIAAAQNVFSEEPLAVLLADQPLVVSDTFQVSQLTTSGFFDPQDLERRIKRSEFDLIVTRADVAAPRYWKRQVIFPEPLRLAIKDVYVPAGRIGSHWLYRPERRR